MGVSVLYAEVELAQGSVKGSSMIHWADCLPIGACSVDGGFGFRESIFGSQR